MGKTFGLVVFAFVSVFASLATAATAFHPGLPEFRGFIKVRPDRELYVDYVRAEPGRPTVVLLNGLTYSTRQFDSYTRALRKRGVGVFRFDFDGMGKSLLRYAPSVGPYPYEQQARDLKTLMNAARLPAPYSFVGLSYGGGIGLAYALMFPRDLRHLILIAPYTEALASQDQSILRQVRMARAAWPYNPASDEDLYDFYLRQTVYGSYPASEPIVLENPFKLEGVYNLVRGIRKFRAIDSAHLLPRGTVHLVTAVSDQYIPTAVLEKFWSRVAPMARMSRIRVFQTEHKIPEAVPEFAAAWTWQILKGNPLLSGGRDFEGWPYRMIVKTGGREIPLED